MLDFRAKVEDDTRMMERAVKRQGGWGARCVEPWRDVERRLQVTRDATLAVTLPRLRFMEGEGCSREESQQEPLLSTT